MKNLWNETEAKNLKSDLLALRVYASRLLGQDSNLVLHGGGNTSVKASVKDFFGHLQDILYIKGSGWDLATIEPKGFAPVRMDVLKQMAEMKVLSDTDMVCQQRAAMLNPDAPAPSVEAILHAIIPYTFVDHSHADAIVAITNTPQGLKHVESIYGKRVLIIPYVMPGFILARKVYELTKGLDWSKYEGMILLNHGLFTFANSAQESYSQHIRLVTQAEDYIKKQKIKITTRKSKSCDLLSLSQIRGAVSKSLGSAVVAVFKNDQESVGFSALPQIKDLATRGTLTPDHVIRTKPRPMIFEKDPLGTIENYSKEYKAYFNRHNLGSLKCLDLSPRWAVWPGQGLITFGKSLKEAEIVSDIVDHTIQAIQWAQGMGGWKTLPEKDLFDVEYWDLEQAKLAKGPKPLILQGKIAIVTGSASGIGKACVECLARQGVYVVAVDINPNIKNLFSSKNILGLVCDVTQEASIQKMVESTIAHFGGLDILVSNAGMFPPSMNLEAMDSKAWEKSIQLNLTSHQYLMKAAIPYLSVGIDPTVIIIASKNVPAPGPGAGAYSVAKAGLTQLGRVAALELGSKGIRVNMLHPNQVFDTAIWTDEVLQKRAKHYGLTVEQYKTNNILHTEITSKDVADLVCTLAGPAFNKTTGVQIPIDGGNERVI